MIINFFSPFYYKGKIVDQKEMKSVLVPYLESKEIHRPPDDWMCDVQTSHGTIDPMLEKYKEKYLPNITEFLRQITFPECKFDLLFPWYNIYRKGQWQESHNHAVDSSVYFSAVHFLKFDPEIHRSMIMLNSNRAFSNMFEFGKNSQLDYWNGQKEIEVNEGDIIIFPSVIEHWVPQQTAEESRITISFNIRCFSNQ